MGPFLGAGGAGASDLDSVASRRSKSGRREKTPAGKSSSFPAGAGKTCVIREFKFYPAASLVGRDIERDAVPNRWASGLVHFNPLA